jgi:hypothetical protein
VVEFTYFYALSHDAVAEAISTAQHATITQPIDLVSGTAAAYAVSTDLLVGNVKEVQMRVSTSAGTSLVATVTAASHLLPGGGGLYMSTFNSVALVSGTEDVVLTATVVPHTGPSFTVSKLVTVDNAGPSLAWVTPSPTPSSNMDGSHKFKTYEPQTVTVSPGAGVGAVDFLLEAPGVSLAVGTVTQAPWSLDFTVPLSVSVGTPVALKAVARVVSAGGII